MTAQGITGTKKNTITPSLIQLKGKEGVSLVFGRNEQLSECGMLLTRAAWNRSRKSRYFGFSKFNFKKKVKAFNWMTEKDILVASTQKIKPVLPKSA
ncbi:MAG: hypothetical protein GX459_13320 [Bacteroidales bacterium]|jgi:hypothetical protein|nr:hypothetical protein [Bacteroidales bacterium]